MFLESATDGNSSQTEAVGDNDGFDYVFWIVIILIVVLLVGVSASIWEIFFRHREPKTKHQQIPDGGPPATPTHRFAYIVGVKADKASPCFDDQISVIKVELLDRLNRYVTGIVVPCFLLKFAISDGPQPETTAKPHPANVRSMTVVKEDWNKTTPGELITWQLVRRRPLMDVAKARITHDCYAKGAFVSLKFIVFYDPQAAITFMINLRDQQLQAIHPCPPSGAQLFPVEKLTAPNEEVKSFINLAQETKPKCNATPCLPVCWG